MGIRTFSGSDFLEGIKEFHKRCRFANTVSIFVLLVIIVRNNQEYIGPEIKDYDTLSLVDRKNAKILNISAITITYDKFRLICDIV